MQLFEKWQSVTDAYKSFYEEARAFVVRSVNILKAFLQSNTEIINAQCGLDKNIGKKLIERILK
ncbi:hypothetical protein HpEKB20_05290 [Helicobacter pylori]